MRRSYVVAAALVSLQTTVVVGVLATDPDPSPWWVLVPVVAGVAGLAALIVGIARYQPDRGL